MFLGFLTKDPLIAPLLRLHRSQGGFRSGYSTLTQASLAHEISVGSSKGIKVFVDLKKAYDKVPIPRLLKKLYHRRIPINIIEIIESLFTSCYTYIAVNGILTDPIPLEIGLFQGSILSPLLFNLFIDDLPQKLECITNPNIIKFPNIEIPKIMLFADDIQLTDEDPKGMQLLLDVLGCWIKENEMEVNFEKTTVMSQEPLSDPLILFNTPLNQANEYTYLGFPFKNCRIDFKIHILSNLDKAKNTLQALKGYQVTWSEYSKLMIFKAYISPILEYGAALVFHWIRINYSNRSYLYELLDNFLKNVLSWIFNSKENYSIKIKMSGLCSFEQRFSELAYRFTKHLEQCDEENPATQFEKAAQGIIHEQSILPRCYSHPIFNPKANLEMFELRSTFLSEFTKGKTLCELVRQKPFSRKLYDPVLKFKNRETRRLALLWRMNRLFLRKVCIICRQPYSRGHISRCQLLSEPIDIPRFHNKFPLPSSYNLLDHLLNQEKENEFLEKLIELSRKLSPAEKYKV